MNNILACVVYKMSYAIGWAAGFAYGSGLCLYDRFTHRTKRR